MTKEDTCPRAACRPLTPEPRTRRSERWSGIPDYDRMDPFFMMLAGVSDQWFFLSSTGGLSVGRRDADGALFPYYTDDRIAENAANTGPITIIRGIRGGAAFSWEPFAWARRGEHVTRTIKKSENGTAVAFEESRSDLGLTFTRTWRMSEDHGFILESGLFEAGQGDCSVEILDGVQNILPALTAAGAQQSLSNLLDAYKRAELIRPGELALFSYGSLLSDLPEPNEALLASAAWQSGLEDCRYLLSSRQVARFRSGGEPDDERESRGQRTSFIAVSRFALRKGSGKSWKFVMDTGLDAARASDLAYRLAFEKTSLLEELERAAEKASQEVDTLVSKADGRQLSARDRRISHHFATVLFNCMRGGIFPDGYSIGKTDLASFLRSRKRDWHSLGARLDGFLATLPEDLDVLELRRRAAEYGDPAIERLCREYLPLSFGRRHGDPSRPWNKFTINVRNPDGSPRLDWQGNWRDVFQNWEALAYSYPEYTESMISVFLDATTADGYNPYKLMRDGIEWEKPDPENPWSNIGYWSDHQLTYLERLLSLSMRFNPGVLLEWLDLRGFSSALVPYRIKDFDGILEDPCRSIAFDRELDGRIEKARETEGNEARLLKDKNGGTHHVSLAEKLLVLVLAKAANLVPDGGIWMNTQRPEWNDANNALAGKGLSVVTTAQLYRFIEVFTTLLAGWKGQTLRVSDECSRWLKECDEALRTFEPMLEGPMSGGDRRAFLDKVGRVAAKARLEYYERGASGDFRDVRASEIRDFLLRVSAWSRRTLRANRREDGMYHSYNILEIGSESLDIGRLDEMLEGQVALLASGLLEPKEALALLKAMRASRLYSPEHGTYLLYPDRRLPGFLEKNRLEASRVSGLGLAAAMKRYGDHRLFSWDRRGSAHFAAPIRNRRCLDGVLDGLAAEERYASYVEAERESLRGLYEEVFLHRNFTGRSGSFFAYEGLGSVYWHMVGKLLLAVGELRSAAIEKGEPREILGAIEEAYRDVRNGLGFNKTPEEYGAFPSDPYSHSPMGLGAKQPGMTGAVKEEIIARLSEIGLAVQDGRIGLASTMLDRDEFTSAPASLEYVDVAGRLSRLDLPRGAFACTLCQVPIMLRGEGGEAVEIRYTDGRRITREGRLLDRETSRSIFERRGEIQAVIFGGKVTQDLLSPSALA